MRCTMYQKFLFFTGKAKEAFITVQLDSLKANYKIKFNIAKKVTKKDQADKSTPDKKQKNDITALVEGDKSSKVSNNQIM